MDQHKSLVISHISIIQKQISLEKGCPTSLNGVPQLFSTLLHGPIISYHDVVVYLHCEVKFILLRFSCCSGTHEENGRNNGLGAGVKRNF